jgi:hypothetical protein
MLPMYSRPSFCFGAMLIPGASLSSCAIQPEKGEYRNLAFDIESSQGDVSAFPWSVSVEVSRPNAEAVAFSLNIPGFTTEDAVAAMVAHAICAYGADETLATVARLDAEADWVVVGQGASIKASASFADEAGSDRLQVKFFP